MTAGTKRRWGGRVRTPEAIARYRRTAAARQRALRVVARMHAGEFAALWAERGSADSPGYDARRDAAERAVARNHPEDFARVFAAEKGRPA